MNISTSPLNSPLTDRKRGSEYCWSRGIIDFSHIVLHDVTIFAVDSISLFHCSAGGPEIPTRCRDILTLYQR